MNKRAVLKSNGRDFPPIVKGVEYAVGDGHVTGNVSLSIAATPSCSATIGQHNSKGGYFHSDCQYLIHEGIIDSYTESKVVSYSGVRDAN